MPVEVAGLSEALKAMRKLQPTIEKNLKRDIKGFLNPVVKDAKSYLPMHIGGLSNWVIQGQGRHITSKTSAFRTGFPFYDVSAARRGIRSEIFPTKKNFNGFVSIVRITNSTAGGSIYETAGRKNPAGSSNSRSNNPNAAKHFVDSLGATMQGSGNTRGRVIYRAVNRDQGKALSAILKSLNDASIATKTFVDAATAFRSIK